MPNDFVDYPLPGFMNLVRSAIITLVSMGQVAIRAVRHDGGDCSRRRYCVRAMGRGG